MKEDNNYVLYNNIPGYYPSETTESIMEYDKNNSMGFTAGIGFEYYLSNAFYLFADPNKPGKHTYTSYPFDNIAIQIGLKIELFDFSKKEKKI